MRASGRSAGAQVFHLEDGEMVVLRKGMGHQVSTPVPHAVQYPHRARRAARGGAALQRHGQVKTITNIPIQPNIVQLEFSLEQIEKSGKCRECSNAVATQRNGFATQRNAV